MKLTSKLILAFLVVGLFSTGMLALSTRSAANREFNKFINDRLQAEILNNLSQYYEENQTWQGVQTYLSGRDHFNFDDDRPLFFSIADSNGKIIIAGIHHQEGEILTAEQLSAGKPISVQDKITGMLIMSAPREKNPMEDAFIHRINNSIFLSGVSAFILALILGAILSRTITRPLRELTKATREIANGRFDQKVMVRSRDEIGDLAAALNKMSADLEHSFNLRKQMTADIAHELRTPLSLIIGHAEAVHDGVLPASPENFEIIREEAERLEKMVNDLRTLSLADAGELSVEFQRVEINKLLSDIQSRYLIPFGGKRVRLTLDLSPMPLEANLDPIRFSQALMNILDNALRYTPEDGVVIMSAYQVESEIEISIADNGEGVTVEEAAYLFDRFYRTDESRTRDEGGSGLGLAITKSIIEMHGAKIWAESEKGKGLKMVIRLKGIEK